MSLQKIKEPPLPDEDLSNVDIPPPIQIDVHKELSEAEVTQ